MLVVGAGGFAKEILEILVQIDPLEPIAFYDDVNLDSDPILFNTYRILRNQGDVLSFFNATKNKYCLGLGNSFLRKKMSVKFDKMGGCLSSVISPDARIGKHNVQIGNGACVFPGAIISNDSIIGNGAIIYFNSIVTHNCVIGEYTEISPAAVLLGRCTIGSYTHIGSNATILPDTRIGSCVIIAAGAVVTNDIPAYTMAAGVPAKIKKDLPR